jgi:hypothetical protein
VAADSEASTAMAVSLANHVLWDMRVDLYGGDESAPLFLVACGGHRTSPVIKRRDGTRKCHRASCVRMPCGPD